MRIAMVSEHANPLAVLGGVDAGGQNVYVAALATQLARQGVEVTVYSRRDAPRTPRRVTLAPGVVVEHVDAGPPRYIPKDQLLPLMDPFAVELERSWKKQRPDVVHAHFWMSGKASVAAAAPLGLPVVQTFHALGIVKRRHQGAKDTSPPERLETENMLVQNVDRIVATCSDELFELLRLDANRRRIRIVPCGVDPAQFSPDGPREERYGSRRRALFVGRLVERKGIGNTITALAELDDVELIVAGGPDLAHLDDDPEYRRLAALAESVGVRDRVFFRGRVDRQDLPVLIRSADVVVCVPWYEPFGIVPLEAMACGVPVVASAVGGLIDTVVDGVTGVHVPPRSPERVAEALKAILADTDLRLRLGAAGVRRVRSQYTWARVASMTMGVYSDLAASVPARRAQKAISVV